MSKIAEKTKHPCWAEFKCYYKVGNSCSFRLQVEAMLSILQEKCHKGSNCIENLADTYSFPCIDLDEKGRQRGIENLFADIGATH